MNPPPPLPPPLPRSPAGLVIAGLLTGIAPMVIGLVGLAMLPGGIAAQNFLTTMLFAAVFFTIAGGWLIAMASTQRLGARILITIAVAVGMFALDFMGGMFLGCFIVVGKA